MKKIIVALIAIVYGIMLTVIPALAADQGPNSIEASVRVLGQCNLDVDNTPIAFGSLSEGATSVMAPRNVATTGNTNTLTTVSIWGIDWTGTGITPPTMSVDQTMYGVDVTPNMQLALTPGTNLFNTSVDESHTTNFQVTIPTFQAADTYTQTITIGFTC